MKKPSRKDRENLAEILRVASKCVSSKDLTASYGPHILHLSQIYFNSLHWWPEVSKVAARVCSYGKRGEWWSTVYDDWPQRFLTAAKEEKILFGVAGAEVSSVPDVPPIDRELMKLEFGKILRIKMLRGQIKNA